METNEVPKRKHPRLKNYDYCQSGAYFITICSFQKQKIFSSIETDSGGKVCNSLSVFGQIAENQIKEIQSRFNNMIVDKYVIMPNHIHILLIVADKENINTSNSVCDAVCVFKSITAKQCRKIKPELKVFQTSFHDHIIRNENSYQNIWEYIDTNVQRWEADCFFL